MSNRSNEGADPTWWLLVDGYNVIAPTAPPQNREDPRWLDIQRRRLLDRLADHLPDDVRTRTCVVFDAKNPPAGVTDRLVHREIHVRFAVGYDEADDLIEALITQHSAPKRLMVVSSDHRISTFAARRQAATSEAESWFDDLLEGNPVLAFPLPARPREDKVPERLDDAFGTVEEWLEKFSTDDRGPGRSSR